MCSLVTGVRTCALPISSSRGEIRAKLAEARLPAALRPDNPLQTLRANLGLSSVAMHHAIRCAVCLGIAVACERLLEIPHGAWIPMKIGRASCRERVCQYV